MMYTYGFLLFVILIAQIGAGIAAFLLKGDLNSAIESNMKEGMKNYGAAGHDGVEVTWDTVQKGFECCGVKTWEEWKNVSTAGLPRGQVPESCCLKEEQGCGENPTAGDSSLKVVTTSSLRPSLTTSTMLESPRCVWP